MARELNPSPCYFVIILADYLTKALRPVVDLVWGSPVVVAALVVGTLEVLPLVVPHNAVAVDILGVPVVVVLAAVLHIDPVVGMLAAFHNLVVVAGILVAVPVLLDLCPASQSALPYQP